MQTHTHTHTHKQAIRLILKGDASKLVKNQLKLRIRRIGRMPKL